MHNTRARHERKKSFHVNVPPGSASHLQSSMCLCCWQVTEGLVSVLNHSSGHGRKLLITAAARERRAYFADSLQNLFTAERYCLRTVFFFPSWSFSDYAQKNQYLTSTSGALVFHLMQLYGFLIQSSITSQSSRLMLRFCQHQLMLSECEWMKLFSLETELSCQWLGLGWKYWFPDLIDFINWYWFLNGKDWFMWFSADVWTKLTKHYL